MFSTIANPIKVFVCSSFDYVTRKYKMASKMVAYFQKSGNYLKTFDFSWYKYIKNIWETTKFLCGSVWGFRIPAILAAILENMFFIWLNV